MPDQIKNYFSILKLPVGADHSQVILAKRLLSIELHPDKTVGLPDKEKNAAENRLKEINDAFDKLNDPAIRAAVISKYSKPEAYPDVPVHTHMPDVPTYQTERNYAAYTPHSAFTKTTSAYEHLIEKLIAQQDFDGLATLLNEECLYKLSKKELHQLCDRALDYGSTNIIEKFTLSIIGVCSASAPPQPIHSSNTKLFFELFATQREADDKLKSIINSFRRTIDIKSGLVDILNDEKATSLQKIKRVIAKYIDDSESFFTHRTKKNIELMKNIRRDIEPLDNIDALMEKLKEAQKLDLKPGQHLHSYLLVIKHIANQERTKLTANPSATMRPH